MHDPENLSASVHRKRSLTPSLALKFLGTGQLNPRLIKQGNGFASRLSEPFSSVMNASTARLSF